MAPGFTSVMDRPVEKGWITVQPLGHAAVEVSFVKTDDVGPGAPPRRQECGRWPGPASGRRSRRRFSQLPHLGGGLLRQSVHDFSRDTRRGATYNARALSPRARGPGPAPQPPVLPGAGTASSSECALVVAPLCPPPAGPFFGVGPDRGSRPPLRVAVMAFFGAEAGGLPTRQHARGRVRN
jgi:hypothetical protein